MRNDANSEHYIRPDKVRTGERLKARTVNDIIDGLVPRKKPDEQRFIENDEDEQGFGREFISKYEFRVYVGDVNIEGVSQFSVGPTTLDLSASTEWIFVEFLAKSPSSGTIKKQANKPKSTNALIQWILCRCVKSATNEIWSVAKHHWRGDIRIGTPLSTE